MEELSRLVPIEALQIACVLFLAFLVGLEREEHKTADQPASFGGVRAFPLIGLIGYTLCMLDPGQWRLAICGFIVVAAFLLVSYREGLRQAVPGSMAPYLSGLTTFLTGALVFHQLYWLAAAITVVNLLLLELKERLESVARRVAPGDVLTFTKFLLLVAVILPLLPDQAYSSFALNPRRIGWVVVAVSAVSYGSYVMQRWRGGSGGIVLAAVLGGAYSSTVATVALARQSRLSNSPRRHAGAIWLASAMMYFRLAALLWFINAEVARILWPWLGALGVLALAGGAWWLSSGPAPDHTPGVRVENRNPLELTAALLFAGMFVLMTVAAQFTLAHAGVHGLYGLAALMGVADVDPFIFGIAQSLPAVGNPAPVLAGILIAAASNNAVKGCYAFALAPRSAGWPALAGLWLLACAGLVPLIFI